MKLKVHQRVEEFSVIADHVCLIQFILDNPKIRRELVTYNLFKSI
jgi:hypothetical protein